MKRAYVKPDIVFESFTLSTNIATGCEHVANHTKGVCNYTFRWGYNQEYTIFDAGVANGCDVDTIDEEIDGICYHNPSSNNIFTS